MLESKVEERGADLRGGGREEQAPNEPSVDLSPPPTCQALAVIEP